MRKYIIHLSAFVLLFLVVLKIVHADPIPTCESGKLCNPLRTGDTLTSFLQAIVDKVVLPIGAIVAVLAFIVTGFMYVLAQGNPAKITTANKSLLYTSIGTALLLGAWTLATVVQNTVHSITQ